MNEVEELISIALSYNEGSMDAIDGSSSALSHNPLPDFNGVTAVYSHKKTNIDVLGATKECFDKTLTPFYINV